MHDYVEYLQKVTFIINRSGLPDTEAKILNQLIEKINVRAGDFNCYLAVIGEFSSGKSTLINAFLKDDLLPTSALVTTASSTRLRHGDSLGINAFFHQEYRLPLNHQIQLPPTTLPKQTIIGRFCLVLKKILRIPSQKSRQTRYQPNYQNKKIVTTQDLVANGIEIRSFINKLTADEDVAQYLNYIEIDHPSNFLQDGVVIIDLPGSNAPNDRHLQLTRSVVENEADAAIIIIPAIQPLTQSLIQFIKANVTNYIERCIFVITRLDQVREKDREVVIKSVKMRLQDLFQIKASSIYSCSAQLALDC